MQACNEFAGPISASLRPGNTAPFEEMSQRWRAIGNTVSDLTGPRFEPQTSRSRDERVTARPTGRRNIIHLVILFMPRLAFLICFQFKKLVSRYWDFRGPYFFFGIFYEFVNKNKKRYNFETAGSRNFKFTS